MDLFNLFAKIVLDTSEYEDGIDNAGKKSSKFTDTLKDGLATAGKVAAAGIAAATAAVGALTKASIEGYAEYEQLTGGVETLFKTSSDAVMKYANNAYKTAGLSANAYMETVTSFSASLLQSLDGDTAAAAEKADLAITDMADNANKMGTGIEMIQNAYQGFAKQNFTMLDNLKLGYGGTKEEMERLLKDAEKLSGQKFDISSYADIVDAIHVVQTEMDITGTTAKEAATTIQGSLSAMKSAWQNLVAGIADENADLDTLIGNVVESAETAAGNIVPRITQILSGMGQVIMQIAPILSAEIPNLITSVLPGLVSAGAQLFVGLVTGLVGAVPELTSAVPGIVTIIIAAFSENWPAISAAGTELLNVLGNGILTYVPELVARLPDVVTAIYNFLTENLPKWVEAGSDLLGEFLFGIIDAVPGMVAKLPEVITAIMKYFTTSFPKIVTKGGELLGKLLVGIIGAIPEIALQLPKVITAIVEAIEAGWEGLKDAGKYLLEGLWAGISDKVQWLRDKVSGVVNTIKGWFIGKDGFDEHSPSKWAASVGEYMMEGLAIGMENSKGEVMKTAANIIDEVKNRFSTLADALTLKQDVGDLEYELWERTDGANASEAEKYLKKVSLLTKQQKDQKSIVEAAAIAYEEVVAQYGEGSKESLEYQKQLLQEKLAYQDLLDEIREVSEARKELYSSGFGAVDFAHSTLAKVSATTINAVSSPVNQQISLAANLMLENGQRVASWLLPDLVSVSKANGTPILNPT